jgi:carboxylesterase
MLRYTGGMMMQGAEPFLFPGNSIGCLVLHGFTASPAEVRWLGAHLAGRGWTVHGPRLAGHGTDYRHLARMRWEDWYASALDGYHLLKGMCGRVFVMGHSMGGLLALLLAANLPVDGVVALAAPVQFNSRAVAYASRAKYLRPFTDQTDRSPLLAVVRAEQARRGEPVLGRVRYNIWSTGAVGELYRLAQQTDACLPGIRAPLCLIYSKGDRTVPLANQAYIAGRVGSAQVEQHTLSNSDHILVQDNERETVFRLAADFVSRHAT